MQDGSKRRARLVLIIGVFLAVFAGAFTFIYASQGQTQTAQVIPTTPVLVAAREVPAKTTLQPGDLKVVEYNLDTKPGSALTKVDEAVGKVTSTPISAGEPVLLSKLADPKNPSFVVMPLERLGPDGAPKADAPFFRAFSITVPDANAVGGNVQPGDIVDLMVTMNFDPGKIYDRTRLTQTPDTTVKVVLEKVVILARTASVYTIRGDTDTAERVAYIQGAGGQLWMLLRAPKDERAANTPGQTGPAVIRDLKIRVPEKVLAPPPNPQ